MLISSVISAGQSNIVRPVDYLATYFVTLTV